MNYELWLKNKLTKIRNAEKYQHLKSYIKNIKDYTGKEQQDRVINNMMLASSFYDREHRTNAMQILGYWLRRNGYEW